MIHNLKLIQRRFPNSARSIVGVLFLLSLGGLALGLGLLLLR